jgi:hypothetical protein
MTATEDRVPSILDTVGEVRYFHGPDYLAAQPDAFGLPPAPVRELSDADRNALADAMQDCADDPGLPDHLADPVHGLGGHVHLPLAGTITEMDDGLQAVCGCLGIIHLPEGQSRWEPVTW